jgi:hypothetical protein
MQTLQNASLTTVQSMILLALYWFGVGDPARANIQTAIASRAVQNLRFDQAFSSDEPWVDQELKVRTFWASWLMETFGTLNPGQVHPLAVQALTVPLPSAEDEFASQRRGSNIVCLLQDTRGSESVLAELMKAANFW